MRLGILLGSFGKSRKYIFILFLILFLDIPLIKAQEVSSANLISELVDRVNINESSIEEVSDQYNLNLSKVDTTNYGWVEYHFNNGSIVLIKHVLDRSMTVRFFRIKPRTEFSYENFTINLSTLSEVETILAKRNYYSDSPQITKDGVKYIFNRSENSEWILSEIEFRNEGGADFSKNYDLDTNQIKQDFLSLVRFVEKDEFNYSRVEDIIDTLRLIGLLNNELLMDSISRNIGNGLFQFQCEFRKYQIYGNVNMIFDETLSCIYIAITSESYSTEKLLRKTSFNLRETNEMSTIGYWCSVSGSPPRIVNDMLDIVNDNRVDILSDWVNSLNVEKKIVGSIGLTYLRFKKGKKALIDESIQRKVDEIITSNYKIYGCLGCSYGNYHQQTIVGLNELYGQFMSYKRNGFIR